MVNNRLNPARSSSIQIKGSKSTLPSSSLIKPKRILNSSSSSSTRCISGATPFARLPSDCVLYILEFTGNVIINSTLCIDEFNDETVIDWKMFIKVWFGRFISDGRIKFIFKFGIINECKRNSNFARVKYLLWKMKSLNSSNVYYWETQLLNQITKVSDKKLTFQKKCEVCIREGIDGSKLTKERKIEQKYVSAICQKIENLSKRNQKLFDSTKVVNFDDVPRNIELLKPILQLFPNLKHLKLVDIFCFGMEKYELGQIFDKCTKLELKSKYECGSTLENIHLFPNLEYLSYYGGLTSENVTLLKQLKHLRTLQVLEANFTVHNDYMVEICASLSEFPQLSTLVIGTNFCNMESIMELSNSKTLRKVKLQTLLCSHELKMIQGFNELKSLIISQCIPFIHLSKLKKLEYFEFSIPNYPGLSRGKFRFANLGLLTSLKSMKINTIEWKIIFGDEFRKEVSKLEEFTTLNVELYGDYDPNNSQFSELFSYLKSILKQFKSLIICLYDKIQHKNVLIHLF